MQPMRSWEGFPKELRPRGHDVWAVESHHLLFVLHFGEITLGLILSLTHGLPKGNPSLHHLTSLTEEFPPLMSMASLAEAAWRTHLPDLCFPEMKFIQTIPFLHGFGTEKMVVLGILVLLPCVLDGFLSLTHIEPMSHVSGLL